MNLRITVPCLGVAFAWFTLTSLSIAQTSGADRASAEALFGEGVSLVAAGNYESGCHKFEASQALDATLGTELRLADCYERAGKTASAWATFKHAQGLAHVQGQSDREQLARERVAALEPQLAYLSITFDGPRPAGLVITRNGDPVPLASLGVAVPVDPGKQQLAASAPDHETWQETVDVARRPGKTSRGIPELALRATPEVAASPAAPASAPSSSSSTQRTVGIVTGAVGVVSILTGTAFGIYAKNRGDRSKLDQFCPNDDHNGCTAAGVDLRDKARSYGTASTITFIAGAALLTTGIVLFSTAPSGADHAQARFQLRAAATPETWAASVRGTW